MFKNNRIISLAAALTLGIGACSGDSTNGPDGNGQSMSAKVNGQSLRLSSVFWGVTSSSFFAVGSTDIGIAQETVGISADSITGPGTYDIGGNGSVKVTGKYIPAGSSTTYQTAPNRVVGSLRIVAIDSTQLKGEYSFTAWNSANPDDSVVISDGTLNLVKDY